MQAWHFTNAVAPAVIIWQAEQLGMATMVSYIIHRRESMQRRS